jgi:hypothetical protein
MPGRSISTYKLTIEVYDKRPMHEFEEEKERERKAIEQKANTVGAVVGLMVNVANTVSEKADTRSWLSLPACVNYVRIPLKPGVQTITVSNSRMKKEIKITGEKGVQIRSVTLY